MISFLLLGCGSIGERHLNNLKRILPDAEIDVYDPDSERLLKLARSHALTPIDVASICSKKYDCAFVCTPPIYHVELALKALRGGSNVFIEKPLSSNLRRIGELAYKAKKANSLAFVGYNFRFNKGINIVKQIITKQSLGELLHISAYFGQYLPDWRPFVDYSKSYTARSDLGGGIIYDGSHEIDYLVWLIEAPISVQCQFTRTETLLADTEGIADVLLKFRNNVLGHIHLDFVRRIYLRRVEVLFQGGLANWSMPDSVVKAFNVSDRKWDFISLNESVNNMYLEELRHVIGCLDTNTESEIISLQNGISSLKLSHAIYRSGLTGRRITI